MTGSGPQKSDQLGGVIGQEATSANAAAQEGAVRLRHLASVIHDLGPEVLGYMVAELAGLSSAAVNVAERYAALTPYADFIAANMPQRLCAWRVK